MTPSVGLHAGVEDADVDNPVMDLQPCEKRSLLVLDFGIWGLLITAA